ncbi:DUF445 domain-containing protein [Fictibacillus barbaricus]|uniref:DUF445 domain-containing protein n=1 Tax=Fictibacillus barbaricus TaxID=182136 RepID=A0ABS2Z7F5_9BACL|nr:DUF445 domain-containing protein [Fictibacillus barbaricus]MBN3543952.1 DUF445 domain-containing protein [Fictibacillus barbaricus]GGB69903.1 hypothetical protein GCM10007199_40160 [Fictibacillus barbaricus]
MEKKDKKSKYFAKISLGVMGAGFLISIPFQDSFIGRLLQGGFEAGLVGGLADWFAVTALFRHPLGIPIPHTALLPKNRDRMLRAIISLLENNWLTKESIQGKLKQFKITEKLLQLAEKELYSVTFNKGIRSILQQAISHVNPKNIAPFIEKELKNRILTLDTAGFLQSLINQALKRNLDEKALDYILAETEKWMAKEDTKVKIGIMAKQLLDNTEADGFLKMTIQSFSNLINAEKLGNILQPFILKRIILLQESDNPYRYLILNRIRKELENVQDREKLVADINIWKDDLIKNWNPADQITNILEQLQNKLILQTQEKEFIVQYVLPLFKDLIERMKHDPEKMDMIESWVQKQISYLIEKNHSKIGILVKENLEKLDNETLIDIMENNVGKDLQWIRVNGAICGFLIGIILTIFKAIV